MDSILFQENKIINDPIHGHIDLSSDVVDIIDTPQFQRLRNLKQLGVSYYIFPGASHNRFEHSVGVCHLAGTLCERILKEQRELERTEYDIKCASIAGLCHDLGHGPFSHTFEHWIKLDFPTLNFRHEDMSLKMLDYLIDDNGINIDDDERKLIKSLITGDRSGSERKWMYDIVNNDRNSIDVDKFDYIARDCHSIGLKSSYDYSRLMKFSRVIDDELCFHAKESYNIYEMFHTRYSLFKQIYTHRVGKAIEFMVCDIFKNANPYLKINERLSDPVEYLTLNDHIIHEIEVSKSPELKTARDLIKRLRKRELYKLADEVILPDDSSNPYFKSKMLNITSQDVYDSKEADDKIDKDNIIIDIFDCNYAMKNKNPVNNVRFYTKWNPNESFKLAQEKVSLLIPHIYSETIVRVYSKDKEQVKAINHAFRNLLKKLNFSNYNSPKHAMPSKFTLSPNKDIHI